MANTIVSDAVEETASENNSTYKINNINVETWNSSTVPSAFLTTYMQENKDNDYLHFTQYEMPWHVNGPEYRKFYDTPASNIDRQNIPASTPYLCAAPGSLPTFNLLGGKILSNSGYYKLTVVKSMLNNKKKYFLALIWGSTSSVLIEHQQLLNNFNNAKSKNRLYIDTSTIQGIKQLLEQTAPATNKVNATSKSINPIKVVNIWKASDFRDSVIPDRLLVVLQGAGGGGGGAWWYKHKTYVFGIPITSHSSFAGGSGGSGATSAVVINTKELKRNPKNFYLFKVGSGGKYSSMASDEDTSWIPGTILPPLFESYLLKYATTDGGDGGDSAILYYYKDKSTDFTDYQYNYLVTAGGGGGGICYGSSNGPSKGGAGGTVTCNPDFEGTLYWHVPYFDKSTRTLTSYCKINGADGAAGAGQKGGTVPTGCIILTNAYKRLGVNVWDYFNGPLFCKIGLEQSPAAFGIDMPVTEGGFPKNSKQAATGGSSAFYQAGTRTVDRDNGIDTDTLSLFNGKYGSGAMGGHANAVDNANWDLLHGGKGGNGFIALFY